MGPNVDKSGKDYAQELTHSQPTAGKVPFGKLIPIVVERCNTTLPKDRFFSSTGSRLDQVSKPFQRI